MTEYDECQVGLQWWLQVKNTRTYVPGAITANNAHYGRDVLVLKILYGEDSLGVTMDRNAHFMIFGFFISFFHVCMLYFTIKRFKITCN